MLERESYCGTIDFLAPEVIENGRYDRKVDIWAAGIVLYELATAKMPYRLQKYEFHPNESLEVIIN